MTSKHSGCGLRRPCVVCVGGMLGVLGGREMKEYGGVWRLMLVGMIINDSHRGYDNQLPL